VPNELLLPSQRNDVLERVINAGLKPAEFDWAEWSSDFEKSRKISALIHRPSKDFWFMFERGLRGGHYAIFSPGNETPRESQYPGEWVGQLGYVDQWLGYLRREIEAPDLWATVAAGPGIDAGTSNAPFTPTELEVIGERLAEIETRITELKALQEGQAQYVHETLDYLKVTAKGEGRRNWINMAIGVIFNIVLFLALPPDQAGALFRFGLEHLQGLGIALASAPPTSLGPPPSPGPPPQRR